MGLIGLTGPWCSLGRVLTAPNLLFEPAGGDCNNKNKLHFH